MASSNEPSKSTAWKDSIKAQLTARDASQSLPFKDLVINYGQLLRKNQELRKRLLTSPPSTAGGPNTTTTSAEVERMRKELSESYRQNSQQAKALLDMMARNTEREAEFQSLVSKYDALEKESKLLREQRKEADEKAQKATSTLTVVQTELNTLKTTQHELYDQIEKANARITDLNRDLLSSRSREGEYRHELQKAMELVNRLNEETISMIQVCNELKQMQGSGAGSKSRDSRDSDVVLVPMPEEERGAAYCIAKKPTVVKRTIDAHTDGVNSARYNFQGTQFATGGGDGTVKTWDSFSGNSLKTFRGPTKSVMCVHFSINNELVLGASSDNTCWVWSGSSERVLHKLTGHTDKVMATVLAGTDKLVSGSWDRWIKVWDLQKGFSIRSIPAESKVNDLDFGRGYKVVVSAHMDKCLRIHDMTTGESIAKIQQHNGAVTSVFMCEGSNSILTNGRDHMLYLFDVRYHGDPKVVQTYKDERYRNGCDWNAACMSPDGSYVAAGGVDGTIFIWNARTAKLEHTVQSLKAPICSVAWHPSGHQIVVAHTDKNVQIWE